MFPLGMMIGSIIMSISKEKDKKYKSVIRSIFLISIATALMSLPVMPMFMNHNKDIYFVYYMVCLVISGAVMIFITLAMGLNKEIRKI